MVDRRGKSWVADAVVKYAGAEKCRLPEGLRGVKADIAVVDEFTMKTYRAKTRPQLYDNIPKKTNFLVQACAAELQEKVILAEMRKHGLSLDMKMTEERYQFFMRRVEGWRPICSKRARKLRRRGEFVWYVKEFGSNAWIPPHLRSDHS